MDQTDMAPFDQALWNWPIDRPLTLKNAAESVIATTPPSRRLQLVVETVFTESVDPALALLENSRTGADVVQHRGASVMRLTDDSGSWVLACFPTRSAGVYQLVGGLPTTHANWKRVERWLASSRDVSRCYLNHNDFADIGTSLGEFGEVEVVKMTGRVVDDDSSVSRGFPARGEMRPSPAQALDEFESMGAAMRTVTVSIEGFLHAHVRRMAGATYYSGSVGVFIDRVLGRLESAASKRRDLLANRARTSSGDLRPLAVYLSNSVLDTAQDVTQVLETIRSIPRTVSAVINRTPYLQVAILDQVDGSNCDVIVDGPASIGVYPGFRASMPALERLSHELALRFGAHSISDMVRSQPISLSQIAG